MIEANLLILKFRLHNYPRVWPLTEIGSEANKLCCYYFLGDKRYRLQRGDIIIIPPGISHRPLFLEELTEPYERIALWFNAEFLNGAIESSPDFAFALSQCGKRGSYLLRSSQATWSGLLQASTTFGMKVRKSAWAGSFALI